MKNIKPAIPVLLITLFSLCALLFAINLSSAGPGCKPSTGESRTSASASDSSAYRSVFQVIDNTFYHWLEYENPESGSFFIYTMAPERKALKNTSAELLMHRSRQWENNFSQIIFTTGEEEYSDIDETADSNGTAAVIELPSTAFSFTNETGTTRERMVDDRTILPGEEATTYPYNTVGFLSIAFPPAETENQDEDKEYLMMRATAFIINSYTILTNAHCLYSNEKGGLFESADFFPAQYELDSETVNPYSAILPVDYDIDQNFKYYEDLFFETGDQKYIIEAVKYDLAALFTDQPINDISTYVPLEFKLESSPANIRLAGYPGTVRGTETKGMWLSEGPVISSDSNILKYEAFTSGGNSGSPVLYYNREADTYRVIAVHSFTPEDLSYSGGPYFSDTNLEMVREWMQYEPGEADNNDNDTGPGETVENDTPVLGDVNGDGVINIQDVVLTIRHALEIELLTGARLERADVNRDGQIDILDVTLIMRFSLGLIDTF